MKHSAIARWVTLVQLHGAAGLLIAFLSAPAVAGLLGPGDTAIAIDAHGQTAHGRYPGGESPSKALDELSNTKYLNFGGKGSGFIVTPFAPLAVESFRITTANDAATRDPATWELYGFNGDLITTDSGPDPAINPSGLAEAWTLIDSGSVALPDTRETAGPLVDVNNIGAVDYAHYKMLFPTLKSQFTSIMQIADIEFYLADDGTSPLLEPLDPIIAVNFGHESRYPAGENPGNALDQNAGTKYLNFGEENSGLIITNSSGPVQVGAMRLTTANDVADRDPASYELWGTNDPIQTANNTDGLGGEVWTLISSGPLSLPGDIALDNQRGVASMLAIDNDAMYSSYKLIFPTTKNPTGPGADSMQIADVQFFVPEPSSLALVMLGGLAAALTARRRNG